MSFVQKIINQVKMTIKEYNMFEQNDTVVVGVSGGADSVMLLDVLNSIKNDFNLNIVVAHINHKIRQGAAEKDAEFVKQLCQKYNFEFHLKEAFVSELAKNTNMSEEEAGRKVRYDFFHELAGKNGKIATAHNANDNVETVLMRFMRGTGIKGLSGIPFVRDNIVRPILNISRSEIEQYIEEQNLVHITDETNFDNIYTRNKIRLDLIPFIQNQFNPNFINTLNDNILTYREDAEYFENKVNELFLSCVKKENNSLICSLNIFEEQAPAISKRLLVKMFKEFLEKEQNCINADTINKIYTGLNMKVGTTFIVSKDCQARIGYGNLYIERREREMNKYVHTYEFGKLEEEHVTYPELNLNLSYYNVWDMNIVNTPVEFFLPFSEYEGKTLQLRTSRDGDVVRVEDGVHKKLSRFLTDKKVDKSKRDNLVLLCDNNEVLCVFGLFATRFKERTGKFMKVVVQ